MAPKPLPGVLLLLAGLAAATLSGCGCSAPPATCPEGYGFAFTRAVGEVSCPPGAFCYQVHGTCGDTATCICMAPGCKLCNVGGSGGCPAGESCQSFAVRDTVATEIAGYCAAPSPAPDAGH
jgi:hypothetical protein